MEARREGDRGFAVLGGGCFWCIEAVYQKVEGVTGITVGYAGGTVPNPTYELVCTGTTGHAEVARIDYDPERIGFSDILAVFFKAHDPTTLNRQGADVGSQYRSIVLYADEQQRTAAERAREEAAKGLSRRVVTEIAPLGDFFAAEEYHRRYFERNPGAAYCRMVIAPKLRHLEREPMAFYRKL